MDMTYGPEQSVRVAIKVSISGNNSRVYFRRDSQVQDTNDRDLKFKVHFTEVLQIQSLK
jgi:hypothetical protein